MISLIMTMYFILFILFNFHATYIKYYHVNLIASRTGKGPGMHTYIYIYISLRN